MTTEGSKEIGIEQPVIGFPSLLLILLAVFAGTLMAAVILPAWIPSLTTSLLGAEPKVYWFLSRGFAMVAYDFLWLSMVFGLIITNKVARIWPGGPVAVDLHQYVSLLGLAFALMHGMILMGDHFINYNLFQVFVPFASTNYRPVWVGLGQIAFYVWAIVAVSFYFRKRLGYKNWRLVHYASFIAFLFALIHGLISGTDTGTVWASSMYWFSGGSLLLLLFYRIMVNSRSEKQGFGRTVR